MRQKIREYYTERGLSKTVSRGICYAVRNSFDWVTGVRTLVGRARHDDIPLPTHLRAWATGFDATNYLLYNIEQNDPDQYAPTSRLVDEHVPSEAYRTVLNDKFAFHLSTAPHLNCVPELFGTIEAGVYRPMDRTDAPDSLVHLLNERGTVVLKPTNGYGANGFYRVSKRDDGYEVNGRIVTGSDVADVVASLDGYIVTEYVEQHGYAETIYPESVNTLRLVTVVDPDTSEGHVVRAIHRFGSPESSPADNFHRGGYTAPVERDTGRIKSLVEVSDEGERIVHETHPETGSKVRGVDVPRWGEVVETAVEAASLHSSSPCVGWDIAVTPDGPAVIEANVPPGPYQLEKGLFEEELIRKLTDRERSTRIERMLTMPIHHG